MTPNIRLRTAAEEAHAQEREKDSAFGPRPTKVPPPPGPIKTNVNQKPGAGTYMKPPLKPQRS